MKNIRTEVKTKADLIDAINTDASVIVVHVVTDENGKDVKYIYAWRK
jgi:hypothetical protein